MSNRELKSWRTVKLTLVRERSPQPYTLRGPSDVAKLVRLVIDNDPRECFVAVYMDARHRPIALHRVSIGTADLALAAPREVFGPALMLAATSIVVAHNHPSGDPAPSAEDRKVTDRLRSVGELIGVNLVDHIVIGADRFYSFSEEGTFSF